MNHHLAHATNADRCCHARCVRCVPQCVRMHLKAVAQPPQTPSHPPRTRTRQSHPHHNPPLTSPAMRLLRSSRTTTNPFTTRSAGFRERLSPKSPYRQCSASTAAFNTALSYARGSHLSIPATDRVLHYKDALNISWTKLLGEELSSARGTAISEHKICGLEAYIDVELWLAPTMQPLLPGT